MARYVVTIPSSKSAADAFALMADMRTYTAWDRGITNVVMSSGDAPGLNTVYDVTVRGVGGRPTTLRYTTTEYTPSSNVLLVGKNSMFTSIDRITITPTGTGCDITYDAQLTLNGLFAPFNLMLGLVFNKVGDSAAKGLRKVFA